MCVGVPVTLLKLTLPRKFISLPVILNGVYPVVPSLILKFSAFILKLLFMLLPSPNDHPVTLPSGAVFSLLAFALHVYAVLLCVLIMSTQAVPLHVLVRLLWQIRAGY